MKKRRVSFMLFVGAFLSIGLIFLSCQSKNDSKEKKASKYKVVTIKRGDATVYLSFSTQIQSENVVSIYAQATGYIQKIYVAEGDNVQKGSPILKINDDIYRQAVKSTKAAYDNAQLEVKKLTPLVEKGIISPYQLETARSNVQAAQAAYDNAKINLSYTLIKSPVSGVVGRITLKAGSLLATGLTDPVTTVAANGNAWAYFAFDEKKLLQLSDSISGNLKQKVAKLPLVDLLLADGQLYTSKGKLELGSSIIDPTTGSLQLKAVFPNPQSLLRTGSSGTVRIPSYYHHVLLVPQKATFEVQDKKLVFLLDNQNNVHATVIEVVNNTSDQYIVTGGINEGDKIVMEGISLLKDGDKIVPVIQNN